MLFKRISNQDACSCSSDNHPIYNWPNICRNSYVLKFWAHAYERTSKQRPTAHYESRAVGAFSTIIAISQTYWNDWNVHQTKNGKQPHKLETLYVWGIIHLAKRTCEIEGTIVAVWYINPLISQHLAISAIKSVLLSLLLTARYALHFAYHSLLAPSWRKITV